MFGGWKTLRHSTMRWRSSGDCVGYVLVDPFDEQLRLLSAKYMDDAFSRISERIEAAGWDPRGLRFGCMHNGVAVVKANAHVPTAFHGWLWHSGRAPSEKDAERLADGLAEEPPRLLFGGSYRTYVYECPADDGATTLRAMCDGTLDDCTDWAPDWLRPGLEDGTLFARVVEAYGRADEAETAAALLEAQTAYSPDGYRLLRRGIALWHLEGTG